MLRLQPRDGVADDRRIAGLTAFYMFRLYYNIFWGRENRELHAAHRPHEAPLTMTLPLVFLAAVTLVAGRDPFGKLVSSDGMPYTIHIDRVWRA